MEKRARDKKEDKFSEQLPIGNKTSTRFNVLCLLFAAHLLVNKQRIGGILMKKIHVSVPNSSSVAYHLNIHKQSYSINMLNRYYAFRTVPQHL